MGNKLGQPAHQDASYVMYTVAASLTAGIVEETVVLAFVVTTLRQARRPLPRSCSLPCCCGAPTTTTTAWAFSGSPCGRPSSSGCSCGGQCAALIVVHVLWDASIFLGQHWHVVQIASAGAWLLLLLAAGIRGWSICAPGSRVRPADHRRSTRAGESPPRLRLPPGQRNTLKR